MALSEAKVFVLAFCLIFCTSVGAAVTKSSNVTKSTGICHLEVPTIDLISEEQKGLVHDLKGNGSRPGYSKIQICCSGYKLQPHTSFRCVPDCGENGCENGNCTRPNVCECYKGYVKSPEQKCIPTCPIGCVNGVCTNYGNCMCNSGYLLDPKGQYCVPVCTGGCGNGGDCVAPETCKCRPGFIRNEKGSCEYYCEGGCEGGVCTGPNQCSCKPGYQNVTGGCAPLCSRGCKNGICSSPEKCTCRQGWNLDKTVNVCEPHCIEPCLNGDCTAPNECTCKTGYMMDPMSISRNRCVAHCPGGCENGVCTAPNFCICNPGFVKQARGSNVCIKRVRRTAFHPELLPEQL